jgi:ribonuclease HI
MFYQYGEFIGKATNNQAEYMAVIKALEIARGVGCTEANVYSDSLLMIRQLKGQYKVRNDKLLELYYKVKVLEESFKNIKYEHVIRDNIYIRQADKLVNGILDKFAKKTVKPNNILYYTERSKT